jgi:hypothetical protein
LSERKNGCHSGTAGVTQADNGRTFCVRVGDEVAVLLHSSDSRPSVRPPCEVAIPASKPGLPPSDTVPRTYPLRFCAPGHRFSVSIVVVR